MSARDYVGLFNSYSNIGFESWIVTITLALAIVLNIGYIYIYSLFDKWHSKT